MNDLIDNIVLIRSGNTLSITIDKKIDDRSITEEIEAIIQPNNTFRFSFVHPEDNIVEQYTGYIEKSKAWLYPQYGSTFIIKDSIIITEL